LGSGGTTSKKFFPENIFLNLILCFRSIFPYFFGKMSLKYFTSYPNPCFADHPLTGGGGGVFPPPFSSGAVLTGEANVLSRSLKAVFHFAIIVP
jgi:hypothetical protein